MSIENDNENQNQNIRLKKEQKLKLSGFVKTVSTSVIASVLTLTAVFQLDYFNNAETAAVVGQAAAAEETDSDLQVEQVSASTASIADIVEQASGAIVGITNIQEQQQFNNPYNQGFNPNENGNEESEAVESGTGTGVIYRVTDDALYLVTNHHVIEDASTIEVTLYNEEVVTAELVGSDTLTDLAVLKVSGSYDITPLVFGDSSTLRAGEEVIAIGNPLGLDLYGTVTQGIVSAVDRTIETSTTAGVWDMEVIQTDAAINPGNSGGALINTSGQLIGINSMKIAEDDVEGLGFAIPSNDVVTIIEELTANGQITRPVLGVSMINLSEIPAQYLQDVDTTEGVMIAEVDEGGSAAEAGLQTEDIIISIDNQKISDSNELRKYLYTELDAGDVVSIQFYRNGELMEANVRLSSNQ